MRNALRDQPAPVPLETVQAAGPCQFLAISTGDVPRWGRTSVGLCGNLPTTYDNRDRMTARIISLLLHHGCAGCTALDLWSLVTARLPVGPIEFLSSALQDLLWDNLLQRSADVRLIDPKAQPV